LFFLAKPIPPHARAGRNKHDALREKTRRQLGPFTPAAYDELRSYSDEPSQNSLLKTPVRTAVLYMFTKIDSNNFLALVANAFSEGAGPLAGDVHETGIAGDLIEHGQDPLRSRQKAAVETDSNCSKASLIPSRSYFMRRDIKSTCSCGRASPSKICRSWDAAEFKV